MNVPSGDAELLEPATARQVALRVVLALDGSASAAAALAFLQCLPLPAGSQVEVVTALEGASWLAPTTLLQSEQTQACRTFEAAAVALQRPGVRFGHAAPTGPAAQEILDAAAASRADLIVLGTHGRGALGRLLLGSVARNVARHARCPVLVARRLGHELRRVVVAVDESPSTQDVLSLVKRFPFPEGTQFTLCHVVRPYHPYATGDTGLPDLGELIAEVDEGNLARARGLVADAQAVLAMGGLQADAVVRRGDPTGEILEVSRELQADLVVAGARGVSAIQGLLIGSVADGLLAGGHGSVLLVHGELDHAATLVEAS